MFQTFQPILFVIGALLGLYTCAVDKQQIPEDKAGCIGVSIIVTFPAAIFAILASILAWPLALLSAVVSWLAIFFKWVHEYDMDVRRSHFK
jgi:hypothetical protein